MAAAADRRRGLLPGAVAAGAPDSLGINMPAMPANRIAGALRSFPALAVVLIGATFGGCSGGDFFRTRTDMRSDDMHRWMGPEATGSIGMKASQFQLTDNERLLRDLAYPLVEPPLSRPAWKSVWGYYKPLPS